MIAAAMIATLTMNPILYGATENKANVVSTAQQPTNDTLDHKIEVKQGEQTSDQKAQTTINQGQLGNEGTTETSKDGVETTEEEAEPEDNRRVITLDEAVKYALNNSIALQQVQTKADIAKLVSSNSNNTRNDLIDADSKLSSAPYQLDGAEQTIQSAENELESAKALYNQGLMPTDVTLAGHTIPKGTPISTVVGMFGTNINLALHQPAAADPTTVLKGYIENELNQNNAKLEAGKSELAYKTREYYTSTAKYQAALSYAMSSVSNKLSTSTITSLHADAIADLIITMANIQDKITSYSINIYKNKIGLLVQNSYYEALKQQKLLEVKEKAVERGKKQYELAEAAYEVGAKSKDDMIIAKTYYDSTLMSAELQRKDYHAALIELKKNMNMDMGEDIKVAPVELAPQDDFDLEQGLASGKKARLEIRMAQGYVDMYKALKSALTASSYDSDTNQYKEANLLQQEAEIELKSAEQKVESDIRTSYSTVNSMAKIAQKAIELEKGAKETLEIAKVKYEVGFGYDNALLSSMNLESMSGTMVEVLAAEENLVNIQEKAIEAMNGYNLARLKYLNDIGVLPY